MTGVTWTAIVLTPYRPRLKHTPGHAHKHLSLGHA